MYTIPTIHAVMGELNVPLQQHNNARKILLNFIVFSRPRAVEEEKDDEIRRNNYSVLRGLASKSLSLLEM